MFKNVIISILVAVMIASHDACTYCREAMILGMFAVCFVVVGLIEDQYEKRCARRSRRNRLHRAVRNAYKGK